MTKCLLDPHRGNILSALALPVMRLPYNPSVGDASQAPPGPLPLTSNQSRVIFGLGGTDVSGGSCECSVVL